MSHGMRLQVVGVIAAALEEHTACVPPSQDGTLSVGMQAASGIFEVAAAQHADLTASVASAARNNDVSIALEVRCKKKIWCFVLSLLVSPLTS